MQARLEAKIAGFGCMPPSIICGCRRWPSAQAQSEISEPNPYRAIAAGPSGGSSPVILPAIANALAYVAVIVFAARLMTA
jgi:hypothetical protein